MEGIKLLNALKKKFQVRSHAELKKDLGISSHTMNGWKRKKTNLEPNQIANLIWKASEKSKNSAQRESIRPVVEYFPIDASKSLQGVKWRVLDTKKPQNKKIKEILQRSHGIYVFYNSQCEAIYVRKAKRRKLWSEINDAFNRKRDAQIAWKVKHPKTRADFLPAFKKPRTIKKQKVYLHDLASYFSVYQVDGDLTDKIEALLIRVFANELTNTRIERFNLGK